MNRDVRLLLGVPHYMFPICDARDVALAHLKALTKAEANGQHIIVHSEAVWFVEMCHVSAFAISNCRFYACAMDCGYRDKK